MNEVFHTSHRSIVNDPPAELESQIVQNITRTAVKFEKVRAILGTPITVSSWYRNPTLNAAVGGAAKSDHLSGCAVDFIAPKFGSPLDICRVLKDHASLLGFKQLILEHTWVHISWEPIPGVQPKLEVLSLLEGGRYAIGLTDKLGNPLA